MLTTSSKHFYGLALFGLVAAALYGYISSTVLAGYGVIEGLGQPGAVGRVLGPISLGYKGEVGDHVGYVLLLAFGVTNLGLGITMSAFRDADAEAVAEIQNLGVAPPTVLPQGLSPWPLVSAFGVALLVIGLATRAELVVAGLVVLAITAIEWAMKTWSEQATGDPVVNRTIRNRVMLPLEVPIGAVLGAGIVVVSASRLMLALSKAGSIVALSVVAVVVVAVAVLLATRPHISRKVITPILVVFGLVIIALGIGGAIVGEREFEHHGESEHSSSEPAGS